MIRFFRRILRIFRLFPILFYWGAVSVPVAAGKDKWAAVLQMTKNIHLWSSSILKCLNIRVTVHGDVSAYNGGLLVSNHCGYTDIWVHSSIYGMRFGPKSDIRSWPVLGWYIGLTLPIWIDRSSRLKSAEVLKESSETLEHKIPLIIYPEGTSTDNTHVLPFKSSPFEVAAAGGFAVQPMVTKYHVAADEPTPCWYGDMTLLPHLWRLLGIRQVDCDVYLLEPILPEGRTRKQLSEITYQMIAEKHKQLSSETENKNV